MIVNLYTLYIYPSVHIQLTRTIFEAHIVSISKFPSFHLSIYQSIHICIYLSMYLSIYLSIYLGPGPVQRWDDLVLLCTAWQNSDSGTAEIKQNLDKAGRALNKSTSWGTYPLGRGRIKKTNKKTKLIRVTPIPRIKKQFL